MHRLSLRTETGAAWQVDFAGKGTRVGLIGYIRWTAGVTAMDKDRIAGSVKDFAGRVEDSVGDATDDAKARASGRMREATGAVQNLYGQAKDAARNVGDAARDAYENSGDTLRDSSQAISRKVQDNPLGSLLVAGGIGFALALLMTRQPRRPPPRWRY
jgi:uncharacterized protein YjbJ (UPF0337 family)